MKKNKKCLILILIAFLTLNFWSNANAAENSFMDLNNECIADALGEYDALLEEYNNIGLLSKPEKDQKVTALISTINQLKSIQCFTNFEEFSDLLDKFDELMQWVQKTSNFVPLNELAASSKLEKQFRIGGNDAQLQQIIRLHYPAIQQAIYDYKSQRSRR